MEERENEFEGYNNLPPSTSGCSTKEYQALEKSFAFVARSVQNPDRLTDTLFSKGLVNRSQLTGEAEKDQKCRKIMTAVFPKVEFDADNYYRFVDALQEQQEIDVCNHLRQSVGLPKLKTKPLDILKWPKIIVGVIIGVVITVAIVAVVSPLTLTSDHEHSNIVPLPLPSDNEHSECNIILSKYSSSLSTLYKEQISVDDKLNFVVFDHYVSLVIVTRQPVNKGEADEITRFTLHGNLDDIMQIKKPLELNDLFKPLPNESEVNFMLISGAPGIGKSTLALHVARNWKKFTNHRLAILVRLREKKSQNAEKLEDLYIEDSSVDMDKVKHCIEKDKGKDVLWILDGFDELPVKKQNDEESVYRLMCQKKIISMSLSTVIVTSRHSSTTKLEKYLGSRKSKHVEIVGFNKEQINAYVSLAFNNTQDKEKLSNFTAYYSQNPVIMSLMYVPLNTAIITYVFRKRYSSQPIPHTMTQLYSSLVCNLMRRHIPNTAEIPNRIMTDNDIQKLNPLKLRDSFYALTELAYNGIRDDTYTFSDLTEDLGLMNNVTSLSESSTTEYTFNFFHTTLQEYMAAVHISRFNHLIEAVKHKEVVATFYFGISSEVDKDAVDNTTLNIVYEYHRTWCVRLLYEFPRFKFPNSFIHFKNFNRIRPSDFYIAGYLVSNYGLSIGRLDLDYASENTNMFVSGLDSKCSGALGIGNIEYLSVTCDGISYSKSSDVLKRLFNSSKFTKESLGLNFYERLCLSLINFLPSEQTFNEVKVNIVCSTLNSCLIDEPMIEIIVNKSMLITEVIIKPHRLSSASEQSLLSRNSRSLRRTFGNRIPIRELHLNKYCNYSSEFLRTLLSKNVITRLEVINRSYSDFLDVLFESNKALNHLSIPISVEATNYDFIKLSTNHNIHLLKILLFTLENLSHLTSAILSKKNYLQILHIVIRPVTVRLDHCLDFLAQIVINSTDTSLVTLRVEIQKGTLLGGSISRMIMKLIAAKKSKPHTVSHVLAEGIYKRIPDNYLKYIELLIPLTFSIDWL